MATLRTARDRARQQITAEILETARVHLARDGGAALSLRSIARDLEMAPSAIYRYFDGRDALLTALIEAAYESLADAADDAAAVARDRGRSGTECWGAITGAIRGWALEHPHEWGLIFGSPVPGYVAPEVTIVPYTRLAAALVRPLVEAHTSGLLRSPPQVRPTTQVRSATPGTEQRLETALQPVISALLPGLSVRSVAAATRLWGEIVGLVSLELFGHWRNTVLDPGLFFEDAMTEAAAELGLD